jgi:outer membrane lipoprotein-sorting protein
MNTPTVSACLALSILALTLLGGAVAQSSASDILRQTQTNLAMSPWQATVAGKLTSGSATQQAEVKLQVISGTDGIVRLEFNKPAALSGNFNVLTSKETWSYLFVSNQLIQEPNNTAKLNTLAQTISGLGDLNSLSDDLNFKVLGDAVTPDGPAWRLSGTPRKAGPAFASAEMLILKSDLRPLSISLKDGGGKVIGTLEIRNFKRVAITARDLMCYPGDAAVVRK